MSATSAATESAPARGLPLGKVAIALVGIGVVLSVLALLGEGDRSRFAFAYLLAFAFCWAIVLGNLFFVALQHVTRSVWSVPMRRVAEMLASPTWLVALFFLVPAAVGVALYLLGGLPAELEQAMGDLFPWADEKVVEGDAVLEGKAPYLDPAFFVVRAVVFFLIWMAFSAFFVRLSLKQDDGRAGAEATLRMRKWSGPFLVIFALTVTFASFDWLMSLEPHWFSTIFGVYTFSGMTLAALAALTLLVVGLRAKGALAPAVVTNDHLYSLGGLMFAFTCFWAYIAFSQFMLIWYANIPEETVWFVHRTEHGWLAVSWLVVVLRFVLPFLLLLGRQAKMHPRSLVAASVLILLGQVVDLYWLIHPQAFPDGPTLGWQELGPLLLLSGILVASLASFLGRRRAVPVGDPLFEQSKQFHL